MFLPSKVGQTLVLVAPDTRVSELVCYYTLIETLTWIMSTTLNEQMSGAKYSEGRTNMGQTQEPRSDLDRLTEGKEGREILIVATWLRKTFYTKSIN